MAKEHGLGGGLYVGGHDLSGETQTWNISGSKGMQNVTTIRQLAFDRNGLIPDGAFGYETIFDPDEGKSHEYLSTLPTTDQLVTLVHRESLGSPAANMFVKQINYDPTRGNDGALLFKTDSSSSKGTFWDWGRLLTPGMRVDTAVTNGASIDTSAAHAFGLQAYLHVFELDGDDVTVTLQSSSDNGAGDAFAAFTGSAFTQVTAAPAFERITTARNGAVERYLRAVTSGTFTSVTFAVTVVVNDTLVVI